jgi:hypothetical protein
MQEQKYKYIMSKGIEETLFKVRCVKSRFGLVKKTKIYPVVEELGYEYRVIDEHGHLAYFHKSLFESL